MTLVSTYSKSPWLCFVEAPKPAAKKQEKPAAKAAEESDDDSSDDDDEEDSDDEEEEEEAKPKKVWKNYLVFYNLGVEETKSIN